MDYARRFGLVVTATPAEHLVGHAMYVVTEPTRAEVAFTIAPEYQSQGLGTLLLGQLAEAAAAVGITTFEATMLSENRRMLEVLRASGFPVVAHYDWGNVEAEFPTSLNPQALAHFDQREALTAASALRRMLAPTSIAVIGASHRDTSVGGAVVRNLLATGFPGPVYPINPSGGTIHGLAAYPSVAETPGADRHRHRGCTCGECADGGRGMRTQGGARARRADRGLRGGRRRGTPSTDGAPAHLPNLRHARGGARIVLASSTPIRGAAERHLRHLMPRAGRIGMATQSGALGLAAIDFTRPARSAFRASYRWATRPTSRATTCSATGTAMRAPT